MLWRVFERNCKDFEIGARTRGPWIYFPSSRNSIILEWMHLGLDPFVWLQEEAAFFSVCLVAHSSVCVANCPRVTRGPMSEVFMPGS